MTEYHLMNKNLKKIIASTLLALLCLAIPAQTLTASETGKEDPAIPDLHGKAGGGYAASGQIEGAGYSTVLYDATNGLPTSDSNFVLGASDGYVWVGGYSGVFRYNGTVFEKLDPSEGMANARGLFEDSKGRIWVGTNDDGIVITDGSKYTRYTYKDGLPSSSIRVFAEDSEGCVYVGTTAGLCYVNTRSDLVVIDDSVLNHQTITHLSSDASGTVYGLTKDGNIFSVKDHKIDKMLDSDDIGIDKITSILADKDDTGKVYIGTDSGILWYGDFGAGSLSLKKIPAEGMGKIRWISNDCGRIWLASSDSAGYVDENGKFHFLDNIPLGNSIEMMTSDYQGNMWFTSSTQGVMKVVTNNFRDITFVAGIPNEVVNSTCLYGDILYIGTDNGLFAVDKDINRVENELTDYIDTTRVRCIKKDDAGNLWVSTYKDNKGLICLTKTGEIKAFTTENGMPGNEVRCAVSASDGRIIAGTNSGLAVIKDGKVIQTNTVSDVITNPVFLTVAEGLDGEIYAGSDGDGIYVIRGNEVSHLGRDDGLASDVVLRIITDKERGVVWIITSNAIEYLKDGVITRITSFPYNNNYDMYFDDNGKAWVISSYGLYMVDADSMIADEVTDYRLFTISSGLPTTPTANSYSELDEEGNLYFSGRTGVGMVNIDHLFDSAPEVKIYIGSVLFMNDEILPDDKGLYTIPSGVGRIQISPDILDYSMTDPYVHMYLDGAGDDGITVSRSKLTELEYTGLKYGNYNLHIDILDNETGEILQQEVFQIRKMPRLLELLIVRIFIVALLILAAGLFVWRLMHNTIIRKQYVQIRAARDEAERASSAKTRFLANMSHEIRTPINTIMGMDEMLLREDATDVPKPYFMSVVNYALDIKNASESLLGLVNDLLDMSKIESGKMHLVETEYDTADVLRQIISMIRVRSTEKDLYFDLEIDEMLPRRLYGDYGKIKQIVLNLLTNAVKYTDVGGFTLVVQLTKVEGDMCSIMITVRDTGIGVKPEDLDKLFTAYERLDEEKNAGIQGTGLGLDISRRFAQLLGGKLWCESSYGKGSEFFLTFPQKIVEGSGIGPFKEETEIAKGPYVPEFIAPDADILVVDDNPMNLNVIKGLLKSTQMFVTTASSGEECLEKLKSSRFNVVLLDHMMPGMDGVETVTEIRKTDKDLPVYALTANTASGEEFYLSHGFTGYLTKPIDSKLLEKTIMRHLPEEMMMKATAENAVKDLDDIPEDLSWIRDTEGINADEGIKNSGGISPFIYSLEMFYSTIDSNSAVIEKAFNEQDIRLYTIKVHALKSSARIIGAKELSTLAESLENAGNKNDVGYIAVENPALLDMYRSFKGRLQRIKSDSDKSGKEAIPDAELKEAYEALYEVIPQMDFDAVSMILDQLDDYKLPDKDAENMKKIRELLKVFDWTMLEQLINRIKSEDLTNA